MSSFNRSVNVRVMLRRMLPMPIEQLGKEFVFHLQRTFDLLNGANRQLAMLGIGLDLQLVSVTLALFNRYPIDA